MQLSNLAEFRKWCGVAAERTRLLDLSMSWNCGKKPWRGGGLEWSLSRYVTNYFFPSSLLIGFLFCRILAMKTVAMENAQRSRRCERSSPRQLRVFTKRLQFFKETMQTDKRGAGRKHVLQANSKSELPMGRINKMTEKKNKTKQNHSWAGMSAYRHHDATREAGEAFCLFFVRWTHATPTKNNIKLGDLCLCRQSDYFYLVSASKITFRLGLFTWARTLSWTKFEVCADIVISGYWDFQWQLKLGAFSSCNVFTSVRNILTCMTALKKQVFPRLFMPLTGTKVLFTGATLPLGGSL